MSWPKMAHLHTHSGMRCELVDQLFPVNISPQSRVHVKFAHSKCEKESVPASISISGPGRGGMGGVRKHCVTNEDRVQYDKRR